MIFGVNSFKKPLNDSFDEQPDEKKLKRMNMAEVIDGKDSFIDKIFRHIKAYRDGLSAHILKNRLKHDNDVNEKLEAKKANNLKVNKRLNLKKRVATHEVPSYDDWLIGRMNKAASKPKNADEGFQHG